MPRGIRRGRAWMRSTYARQMCSHAKSEHRLRAPAQFPRPWPPPAAGILDGAMGTPSAIQRSDRMPPSHLEPFPTVSLFGSLDDTAPGS